MGRPWYRRWALRVFRDETGLTVNPHLWGSIAGAMNESRYFVLLTSPDAAASPWVNREVEHWLATHGPETILPVLTAGTLVWDNARADYAAGASSALPPALAGHFSEEPRFLDMRWAHDETHLDLRNGRFREAIAALAAPMHGLAKEDLESEDVRRHRHAVRLAWGAAIALVVLTLAALASTAFAVSAARTARDQRHAALEQRRTALAERARADASAKRALEEQALSDQNAHEAGVQ